MNKTLSSQRRMFLKSLLTAPLITSGLGAMTSDVGALTKAIGHHFRIKASGYRGYLPLETLGTGDPYVKVPRLLHRVQQALTQIWEG